MPTLTTRSGQTLIARPLAEGDAPALAAFHANLSPATRALFTPHACDDETIAKYIRRSESGEDRTHILLSGREIVGYFFLWEFQSPVPLLGIGLADAFQGEGLGPQMMGLLVEEARAAGRDGIELTTVPGNDRAFQLYRRHGFEYLGDVENIAGDGRVVVERRMFLSIVGGARPPERAFKPPC